MDFGFTGGTYYGRRLQEQDYWACTEDRKCKNFKINIWLHCEFDKVKQIPNV